MGEWLEWHRRYDSEAGLAARLRLVQEEIRVALDRCPPGPIAIVSICAGDGRDLLGALRDHPRRALRSGSHGDLDAGAVRARPDLGDPRLVRHGRVRQLAFHAIPGSTASVGVNRLAIPPPPFHPGVRLFTFLEREARPSSRARRTD